MVKLVDTPDLGSGASRCEGSSPFARTKAEEKSSAFLFQIVKRDSFTGRSGRHPARSLKMSARHFLYAPSCPHKSRREIFGFFISDSKKRFIYRAIRAPPGTFAKNVCQTFYTGCPLCASPIQYVFRYFYFIHYPYLIHTLCPVFNNYTAIQ